MDEFYSVLLLYNPMIQMIVLMDFIWFFLKEVWKL